MEKKSMQGESAEDARRRYWTQSLDEAFAFMQAIKSYSVEECGEPLADLRRVSAAAGVEVVFCESPHVLGLTRLHYLREGLIVSFVATAREMNDHGWVMRVEDGYRTREMQRGNALREDVFDVVLRKVVWECGGEVPPVDLLSRRLAALIANCPKVGTHMSGTAIDISVLDRDTGVELDRGGRYLELSELTPMASPFISPTARENRAAITTLMARHGFVAYPWEFWHYSQADAYAEYLRHTGKPARYGAVDADLPGGKVTPIQRPNRLLNTPATFHKKMVAALERHERA